MAVSVGAIAMGTVGSLMLLRALWNPHRAVVRKGRIDRCAGPGPRGCEQALVLGPASGATAVYAVAPGRVVSTGPDWVHVQPGSEPVVLAYYGFEPSVERGQAVSRGRPIGQSLGPVSFEVWALFRRADQTVGMRAVEPSSWLAARGLRPAVKLTGGVDLWCGAGREILVPESVHGCALENPRPSPFALLPVSVEQA